MKTIIELITDEIKNVFTECGYDEAYAKVTVSNRPDLCEFQCNGAMAAAKAYKKAPFMIADEVVAKLTDNKMFSKIESVKPGFININICEDYLAGYLNEMSETEKFGYFNADKEKTVYLRYTVKRTGTKDTKEMALAVKNVPVEEVTLEISFDGKAYEKQVSFTAKAGRWVGVKNGMFVNHNNEVKNEGDGFVTVDYIRYRCIDNGRLD